MSVAAENKISMRKINIAVAGLGFMGVTHLRAYQRLRNARVVAVCDAVRLPVNGVLHGVNGNIKNSPDIHLGSGVKIYHEFGELLADRDVAVVDLCTPTACHTGQAMAALKAGKHVLCEKPLAVNFAEAQKVLLAAVGCEKFLMPAMCMRFWPGWSWLKELVAEKTYGIVRAANFRRVTAKPAWGQSGSHIGGALLDLHIHDTDFVNFLFGRPSSLFSTGVTNAAGIVDHVVTQYFYPGGPAVHAEGSWLLHEGFNMSFTLYCERATVDFDLSRGSAALRLHEAGKKMRTMKLKKTDGYIEEIRYFVDCIARGKRPTIVTPQDGATALEICAAEAKSMRTGVVVKL
jgi:predicted dehydrogenase